LLEKEYINNSQPLNYICDCGTQSHITLKKLLIGQRCNQCAKKKRAQSKRLLDLTEVQAIFAAEGYLLLESEYSHCLQPLKYRCPKGHVRKTSLVNFQRGHRCQKCSVRSGSNHYKWNPDRKQVEHNALVGKRCYNILHRCLRATQQTKTGRTSEILGYTTKDLCDHLESYPDWDVIKCTDWHLDHIFPIKAFIDYGVDDLSVINDLSNLKPCTKESNLLKNCHYNKKEFEIWLKEHNHLRAYPTLTPALPLIDTPTILRCMY
jgi:hypothetical protein